MPLFKEIMIWRRIDDRTAMRYTCFQNLSTNLYIVQSADFFYLPFDEKLARQHEKQLVELFIKGSSKRKKGWFESIVAAIDRHDYEFSDDYVDEEEDEDDDESEAPGKLDA